MTGGSGPSAWREGGREGVGTTGVGVHAGLLQAPGRWTASLRLPGTLRSPDPQVPPRPRAPASPALTEDADVGRRLRVAEGAAHPAGVPGVVAAHRARDEQLVALRADPRRLRSLGVRGFQGAAVPAPAQLPAARPPPHAAQPQLGRPLLGLRGLGLHGELGQGLWGRRDELRTQDPVFPPYPHPATPS